MKARQLISDALIEYRDAVLYKHNCVLFELNQLPKDTTARAMVALQLSLISVWVNIAHALAVTIRGKQ